MSGRPTERCARIVADLAEAEQLVTDMQATPRGLVRVTAPIDLSTQHLGTIIAEFLSATPTSTSSSTRPTASST
jgi:DNA-binding transcriptional LysR family regulator